MGVFTGDRRPLPVFKRREGDDEDSCSLSSIGKDSDEEDCDEESEVGSSCKGLLDTMDALQEVLPIKRGISNFYNGKSKSFTSLADASFAPSIKDLAKPENPYTKKRKNIIAHANFRNMNHSCHPIDNGSAIPKRPANSSRSALVHRLTPSHSKNNIKSEDSHSHSSSPYCSLPPLHPRVKISTGNGSCSPPPQRNSPWRSFSLSDLQRAAATYN